MKHYVKSRFLITDSIGFYIARARNSLQMDMDAALKTLGVNAPQMGVLLSIANRGTATPFELSKDLVIDTGLMTRMLDKLETHGWLKRERSLEDRRVVNLYLTEAGERMSAELAKIVPDVLNTRLQTFTKEEFEEFRRLLKKFTAA
ncbi:MFS transporter [Pandoraea thiooxydans]|uniref:MFS transporter n=1 Tax=Pandoraea thiooxydans TaxID=445709 RepID=A0A0G3EQT0_9BURK|nr:MarR family transcriptional regulator [Pandoraea thiooxydans]AKJ69393.1 MFS transporter [Pandoraea thiooxydans]APR97033.1 MFS transporter [Pandoraea thiooxydans]